VPGEGEKLVDQAKANFDVRNNFKFAIHLMMTPTQNCKNCGSTFQGMYCPSCGQKVAHRLNLTHIFHEVVHVFTHADKGIFSLVPAVLFRPGTLALGYVQGKRKRYFSVFQYLIIIVGIVTFIMSKIHFMENMMDTFATENEVPVSPKVLAVQNQLIGWMKQYMNLFLFALIPVFTLFSWLLFRKKGYNYAEHFVLQVVIQAQVNTITLLLTMPLAVLFGDSMPKLIFLLAFVILITSHTISNRQFFKIPLLHAAFKGFLIYGCTLIVQMLIVMAVMMYFISSMAK
jgi:hypothetical protein